MESSRGRHLRSIFSSKRSRSLRGRDQQALRGSVRAAPSKYGTTRGRSELEPIPVVQREWRCGFPIRWTLLQPCDGLLPHQIKMIETEWIGKFPNLLNKRKLGYSGGKP